MDIPNKAVFDQFIRSVWGKPQALLQRLSSTDPESSDVWFIDLGPYFGAFKVLSAGILRHQRILVRDEYHMALKELQTATYQNGAYVVGHPGIGKSYMSSGVIQTLDTYLSCIQGKPISSSMHLSTSSARNDQLHCIWVVTHLTSFSQRLLLPTLRRIVFHCMSVASCGPSLTPICVCKNPPLPSWVTPLVCELSRQPLPRLHVGRNGASKWVLNAT